MGMNLKTKTWESSETTLGNCLLDFVLIEGYD